MDVVNEILDAIEIIVDKKIREQTTQIYPGICKSVNGNSCVMSINGKDNTVQFYGLSPIVGAIYRVFVPYGNMSMAFIITTNGSGSSASGVSSVNGLTGDVNLTASDVGAAPAGYGLGFTENAVSDANTIVAFGCYTTKVNTPTGNWCTIFHIPYGENNATQYAKIGEGYDYQRKCAAKRDKIKGTWQPWEWVNPPMVAGVEYRTTERFEGKPVYCQLVYFTDIVDGGTVTVDVPGVDTVLRFFGSRSGVPLPFISSKDLSNVWTNYFSVNCSTDTITIVMNAGSSVPSGSNFYCALYYTKGA